MTQLKFIRTTHDRNGRCQSFPPEAWQFWRERGAAVGEALRAESQLLIEVVLACRDYAREYPESAVYEALTEEYVAWCLLKLCEHGMAAALALLTSSPTVDIGAPGSWCLLLDCFCRTYQYAL